MRKILLITLILLTTIKHTTADEGMWIPLLLKQINESEMQAMGMRLTAEDIYQVNKSSLKDAILIFGGGCTAEFVSDEGLILTNHHCGYSKIQKHSSLDHNYLKDGFWAMDKSEELLNPNLSVTRLVRMEDVTQKVLAEVTEDMNEYERASEIQEKISELIDEAVEGTHYEAIIKPFFYGNDYYMFINEIFTDVRLVGAPPSNIGKFGGDTDNWMWPRHTGDFSVFRVYANKDNEPADYSEDNVPYKPLKHLSISLKGANENDFTFVFGYPGRTKEYVTSFDVDMTVNTINPIRINMRDKRLAVIKDAMNQSDKVRIQYSAKQSRISNGWKKWIGENRGIKRLKTIDQKKSFEEDFQEWTQSDIELEKKYGNLLKNFEETYNNLDPLQYQSYFLTETVYGVEILTFTRKFNNLIGLSMYGGTEEAINEEIDKLKRGIANFFKDYQINIDRKIFALIMREYYYGVNNYTLPDEFAKNCKKYDYNFDLYAEEMFEKSIFASEEKLIDFLDNYKAKHYKKLLNDPAHKLTESFGELYNNILKPEIGQYYAATDSLMRVYMKGQMEMQSNKVFYPDANFTLRVGYGSVSGYNPDDAVNYNYFTTLSGIMDKEDPEIFDYVVEDKLKDLYNNKDYGRYGDADGSMHVCFTASNHTTGGNSGSPVLDADGNLIGINFDRGWEGTMSDIDYDLTQCRNIAIDIRYCLFIMDKFAGAGHLVEEMTIVE